MRALSALTVVAAGFALSLGALVSACNGGSDPEAGEGDAGAEASGVVDAGVVGPRRPARRYYMTRTDKRCEVYSVEGDVISSPTLALCPQSIEVGERIRLAGLSCLREGRADREQPVVCPMDLMAAEQEGRERDARERAAALIDGGGSEAGAVDAYAARPPPSAPKPARR